MFAGYVLLGRYEDGRWKEKEKKVKNQRMEESGRYIRMWRRKLRKKKKEIKIYCVDILF